MRWSAGLFVLVLVGCATADEESMSILFDFLEDAQDKGGIVEICPPGESFAILHFDGPPHVATDCLSNTFEQGLPNCEDDVEWPTLDSQDAICRAYEQFRPHVDALGTEFLVSSLNQDSQWRVEFATLGPAESRRVLRVVLPVDPSKRPFAIVR